MVKCFMSFVVPLSLVAKELAMRAGPLDKIQDNVCRPCVLSNASCSPCEVSPKGDPALEVQPSFGIRYHMTKNGASYDVALELEGKRFPTLKIAESVVSRSILPFRQCRFYREHRFRLYGLKSFDSVDGNSFMHYFVRNKEDGAFYYLRELGDLTYDEEAQEDEKTPIFAALGSSELAEEDRLSYYKLENNALKCVKGGCLK